MPKINWAHICEDVKIDKYNKISITNLITGAMVKEVPFQKREFKVIIEWQGKSNDVIEYSLQLIDPDEKIIAETNTGQIVFKKGGYTIFHSITPFRGVIFPVIEDYSIGVNVNGTLVHVIPFSISVGSI